MKLKKSYRPRLRVRANSDSKKKVKKLKLIKNYKKKSTRAKISPCKIVCSSKSVFVQNCLHAKLSLCIFLRSCKFDSYPSKVYQL